IEPSIQADLVGGFYTPSDFSGDIHSYTRALSAACERKGVQFRYQTNCQETAHTGSGVRINWSSDQGKGEERFDAVVVCAGVGSRDIASSLGDRVNVYPVKGYSITVQMEDTESQAAAPKVSLLDDKAKIVSSRLGPRRFRIAGTAEFNGYNRDIRDDRIKPLVKWCETLFPTISTEHAVPWAGLRPMMPSMMPKVDVGARPGVFYNTGHGHLGWTLSAATAEIIAERVLASSRSNIS
ncbi:MAG: FAD-dependent oxidoreductase, partial [Pseudomonadota bacterium]